MAHYEEVGGERLAEEFYAELRRFFLKVKSAPEHYAIRARDLRRVNLDRFPYHFLYRVVEDRVRVLVVRHHSRRPALATSRR
jgi:hypothetical protein